MNDDFNPYAQQPSADNPYANPQNAEPQYPQYPQYQQPQQYQDYPQNQQYQQYQPYQQQNQMPQQPYPYQQPYYYNPQPQGNKGAGMAKAFSIVSFATGCLSMLVSLVVVFLFFVYMMLSSSSRGVPSAMSSGITEMLGRYSLPFGLPGVIFGIIALVKKTKLPALAVMGVIFNGVLLILTLFGFFAQI